MSGPSFGSNVPVKQQCSRAWRRWPPDPNHEMFLGVEASIRPAISMAIGQVFARLLRRNGIPLRRGLDETGRTQSPSGHKRFMDGTLSSALRLGPGQSNAIMKIV